MELRSESLTCKAQTHHLGAGAATGTALHNQLGVLLGGLPMGVINTMHHLAVLIITN